MKVWITLAWAGMATWASMVAATAAPIDTARSRLSVSFRQMNVPVEATFTRFGGDVSLDPSRPMQARAKLEIDPASFHMGVGAEDYAAEVRRKDWFDTARFPRASFVLTRVQALGSDRYEAVGTLEVKGRVADVTAALTLRSESGGNLVLEGSAPLRRLALGVGEGEWVDTSVVADEVIVRFRLVFPVTKALPQAPITGGSAERK
jgi:polyisoprenoid-binding protein YceI